VTLFDSCLVLEPNVGGHRLAYVSLLCDAPSKGQARWLTVVGAPGSQEAKEHLDTSTRDNAVTRPPGSRWVTAASNVARIYGVTHLVIPDGDVRLLDVLLALPRLVLRRQTASILLMRTGKSEGRGNARRLLMKRALVRLLCLVPGIRIFQLTDCFGVGREIRQFRTALPLRDPILSKGKGGNPVRHLMSEDRVWVGVCGLIDPRKNVDLAIAAVAASENLGLVLAGRLSPEVTALLASDETVRKLVSHGRLLVCDRLLPDAQLDGVLADLQAILILHDNDSPSGIMGRAAVLGTPAVVPVGGWLAHIVDLTGVGRSAELTPHSVLEAVQTIASDAAPYSIAARRAMDGHSPDELPMALSTQPP
jgi:hypothetical protein